MKKILGLIGKIFGVVLFISAFLTWISYYYPDFVTFSPRSVFLNFGVESIGMAINWGLVVVQIVVGMYLWKLEKYLK